MPERQGGGGQYYLRVLGSFGFHDRSGREVALRPLAGKLLSALALKAGQACTLEWLIDAMWAEDPPASAKKSVQNTVARVRRQTGQDVIETTSVGYRLGAVVTIDRWELRRLATDTRSDPPHDRIDPVFLQELIDAAAGGSWQLLAELPDVVDGMHAVHADVHAVRLQYAELVARRDPRAAVPLTTALVDDYPLDEGARALHAITLHRSGRRAESLREIKRARRELDEERMPPGPQLEDAQRRILHDDVDQLPAATAAYGKSRVVARDHRLKIGHFVGRVHEVSTLRQLAARTKNGAFAACLVTGKPGIGKTWLAARLTADVTQVPTLFAACPQHGSGPLQPVVDALRFATKGDEVQEFVARLEGHEPKSISSHLVDNPLVGLHGIAADLSALLAELAPVTLIVDDVQWADDATVSALCQMVAHDRPPGVFLLVLRRPGAPAHRSVRRLDELISRHGPVITLHGLSHRELADLVGERSALLSERDIERISTATGGNPLIASMLLRSPAMQRPHAIDSAVPSELSTELNTLVGSQLAMAGDAVKDTLRWIAICEHPHDLGLLASVSGLDHYAMVEAAERASDLGLAVETGTDRFEIAHTTLRAAILHGLSRTRCALMHAAIRDVLMAPEAGERWTDVVHHALRASGPDAQTVAAQATLRAAKQAIDRFSPLDALALIEDMTDRVRGAVIDPALTVDLFSHAALAAGLAFDNERRDQLSDRALDLARQHQLYDRFAEAALVRAVNWQQGEFDRETEAIMLEALELLAPSRSDALRAKLLANLSGLYAVSARALDLTKVYRALDLADDAMSAADRSGDPQARVAALQARIVALWATSGYAEQIELADRIMELDGVVPHWQASLGLRWRAIPRFCRGDRGGFRADMKQLARIAERNPGRGSLFTAYASQWHAMDVLVDGDWPQAAALVTETLDRFPDDRNIASGARSQLAWIALETGTAGGLVPEIEQAAAAQPDLPALGVFAAFTLALLGETERATARLETVIGDDLSTLPVDITWTSMIAAIAEICALSDNTALATEISDVLVPWHGTMVCVSGGLWCLGAAERSTALFHHTAGNHTRAASLLRRAETLERDLDADAVVLRGLAWQARFGLVDRKEISRRATAASQHGLLPIVGVI